MIAAILLCALVGAASAAGVADIPWNQSNIAILRGLDKAAVEKLVNDLSVGDVHKTVGDFTWTDLVGDGRYELITTLDLSGRAFFDYLAVYERDDLGKISVQWFSEETAIGRLRSVIRDLDNDSKKELIIPTLFPSGAYGAESLSAAWPAVYKLENGIYVEASDEFGNFYDTEVLPGLIKNIAEARAKPEPSASDVRKLISSMLEKDKILRVLGRDRSGALAEAREWAASDDPNLAHAGAVVLREMNGKVGKASPEKELPRVVVLRKSSAG